MKYIKKLLNLKFLIIIYFLYGFYLTANLFIDQQEIDYLVPYTVTTLGSFATIIFAPITEEIIYRYWAYGKNIQLQFSLFITFLLFISVDFYQNFIHDFLNITKDSDINGMFRHTLVILIGLIIYYFIKKYNFTIPSFFSKLTKSTFVYLSIIFLFAITHLYKKELNYDNLFSYIDFFIASYLLTRHAKDYGIFYAILLHIAMNAAIIFDQARTVQLAAKNLVSDQLLFTYFLIAVFFVSFYFIQFMKAKPLKLNQR